MSTNMQAAPVAVGGMGQAILERYRAVRQASEKLCEPLETEDFVVQTMPDVSPTKWHLAHTTWFFETFVLSEHDPDFEPTQPKFRYLFNSYYNAVGEQFFRPNRGLLSRPTVREVFEYRRSVDRAMEAWLRRAPLTIELETLLEIGLHHEQQHQELMLTDLKHVLASNVLRPKYHDELIPEGAAPAALTWVRVAEGIREIGHEGDEFAFDNESPRHRQWLPAFEIASRLVTNDEFLEFVRDGGYERPELWLSDAWGLVQEEEWKAPLYWRQCDGDWIQMTLSGERPVSGEEPVCHVSFYEADAYARWAGARLPSEAEWETVASRVAVRGNFVESGHFHPVAMGSGDVVPTQSLEDSAELPRQMFGDVWEWTQTPYQAYPGYTPPAGALGEYNAKFMCNQMILRGGSCATPVRHIRATYRNFFPPSARWQFAGIRIARDA